MNKKNEGCIGCIVVLVASILLLGIVMWLFRFLDFVADNILPVIGTFILIITAIAVPIIIIGVIVIVIASSRNK